MKITSKISNPVDVHTVEVRGGVPKQVFVNGPVKCRAIVGDGFASVPLGVLDGLVEFETRNDWLVMPDGPSPDGPLFVIQKTNKVVTVADEVSYTSLDLPRPPTEMERMLRIQQSQIDKLMKAQQNVSRKESTGSTPEQGLTETAVDDGTGQGEQVDADQTADLSTQPAKAAEPATSPNDELEASKP